MPKPEAVDRVLSEARVVVARVRDMFAPEWRAQQQQVDYFGLIATSERLELALSDIDVQPGESR